MRLQEDRIISCEVTLVCPVFNEESLVAPFFQAAKEALSEASEGFEVVFVDDGSSDATWSQILSLAERFPEAKGIRLSKNFGKEIALVAGLAHSQGKAHVPIDVDFQDPIELIPEMLAHWRAGFSHVIPRRISRSDGVIRVLGARMFYGFLSWLTAQSVPSDVGDFRLLDESITGRFLAFRESGRVNKVVFSELGGKQKYIEYHRPSGVGRRNGGQSLRAMLDLTISAVSSNSAKLMRRSMALGIFGLMLGTLGAVGVVLAWLLGIFAVPGQATTVMIGTLIIAIQLVTFGFLGIVVAEVLREAKRRPLYFVDETTD